VLGLGVNVASAVMLGGDGHDHGHGHHHHDDDDHDHADTHGHDHPHHRDSHTHRDHNLRAALVHVMADAAVSVLVIVGLLLGRFLGWVWMDPLAGLLGAIVIASWSYALIRDTGSVLLDMMPDPNMAENIRMAIERDGDRLCDLHLWRLGPGHIGAIVSIATVLPRAPAFYRERLASFRSLSHVTIEVHPREWQPAA
jgi:cation diffusion facilitator family transporter